MTISIARLRKFQTDSDAAHAALMAVGERIRHARKDKQAAADALRVYMDTSTLQARKGSDDIERTQLRLERELAAATEALAAAEAARSNSYEKYDLARSLYSRGRDFAASIGMLPADMEV